MRKINKIINIISNGSIVLLSLITIYELWFDMPKFVQSALTLIIIYILTKSTEAIKK